MSVSRPEYSELELPEVEPDRRARTSTKTVLFVLVPLVLIAAGAVWRGELEQGVVLARDWLGGRVGGASGARGSHALDPSRLMLHTVQHEDLRITTKASGTLESASSAIVLSEVEGEVAILAVLPEGSRVAAGDVVVELDSSALRARETEQEIVVENARAAVSQLEQTNQITENQAEGNLAAARLLVEFAKLDLEKYEKGDYPLELRQLQIETALAQEELERARVQLRFSEDLAKDGYIHAGELEADRSRVTQADFKLENARGKERSLQEYAYPRAKRDLDSKMHEAERALARVETQERLAAEQAERSLEAKKKTLDLEEKKLTRVRDQLGKCAIRAPQAGIVVYPVPPDEEMIEEFIRQGNRIKERKHVFSIPDTDVLQVTTSIHEALVRAVRPGLPARIWIDSAPDIGELRGSLQWISPTPEPGDWRRTTVKFYEAKVSIDGPGEELIPGMSAKVEILLDERPGVLAVPVMSVVQRGSAGVCYVAGARPELRRLRLGKSSTDYVEVVEGLSPGEQVVMSPDLLGIPADAFEDGREVPALVGLTSPDSSAPEPSTGQDPGAGEPEEIVQELEYEAELTGVPVTSAMAEFKIKTKNSVPAHKFKVKVSGGPPGVTYPIRVDNVYIGDVTLDDTGTCALELSTKLGNFPEHFPLYAGPGTVVELGSDLKGVLAVEVVQETQETQ